MKYESMTNKSAAELHQMLEEERQRLAKLKFDLADRKLKKTSDVMVARRKIARILTALRAA